MCIIGGMYEGLIWKFLIWDQYRVFYMGNYDVQDLDNGRIRGGFHRVVYVGHTCGCVM